MREFAEIVRFEFRLQARSPLFAGLLGLFFVIHLLTMAAVGIHISDNALININSTYKIFQTELVLGLFGMLPAVLFAVRSVAGDHARAIEELFYTTPVGKAPYLLGRFLAGFALAGCIGLAGMLGTVAATFMPWLDQALLGPFEARPYLVSFLLVDLPTLFVCCALFFSVAALTRSQPVAFGAALGLVVLELLVHNTVSGSIPGWLLLADPFGGLPITDASRFWTVSELNTQLPVTAWLLANRLLWTIAGATALAVTVRSYRLTLAHRERGAARRSRPVEAVPQPSLDRLQPPRRVTSGRATLGAFASQVSMDVRSVWQSPLFWLVLLFAAAGILSEATSLRSPIMSVPLHPLTSLMLGFFRFALFQFVLLIVIVFSGQLVHRERECRLHEVIGASPHADWIPVLSRTLALCLVVSVLLVVSMLTTVGVQVSSGYRTLEPWVYLQGLFIYDAPYFFMFCVLAVLIQTMSPNKWTGMVILTAVSAALLSLEGLGYDHVLYGFRIPFVVYSDMNGFGHFARPTFALIAYWGASCVLLLIVTTLLHSQGTEAGARTRLHVARIRLTRPVAAAAAGTAVVCAAVGGYIFYNTNILNAYETPDSRLQRAAGYERRYGVYKQRPGPAFSDITLEVDLFPDERRLESRGQATLRNNKSVPLQEFMVSADPRLRFRALSIDTAVIVRQEPVEGAYVFRLTAALAPGESVVMRWDGSRVNRGFVNAEPDNEIVENGTFVNLQTIVPLPSYDQEREVVEPTDRRRLGLPPAPRLPALGDPASLGTLGFGVDGRTSFKVTFSTSSDQTAVASGALTRQWDAGTRRYFEYQMEAPIWPRVTLCSARYAVARDSWNGVAIEVYHDPKHAWNVPVMLKTAKQSLEYFSREYGAYPLHYYRILEYPRYRGAAQAFPGAIAYSESAGFLTDLRGWASLDYATIHELAHQWWGGQIYGARMQGRQMLNETMAQYSTFMVFREYEDPRWLRQILASTLEGYLDGRSSETVAELPVTLTEDQGYISYNKGALAMFALQDLLGADRMGIALRRFLARFAMQPPPYPTSRDLITEIRAVAGPEHQALITDLFEKIVLYDVQAVSAETRAQGSEFEVTLTIAARQFEADGVGKESEVPLDTWFDVAIFAADAPDVASATPVYLQKHRLHSGSQQLVIRVPKKPGVVGVDPFHLMIDRTPGNNVLRLPGR